MGKKDTSKSSGGGGKADKGDGKSKKGSGGTKGKGDGDAGDAKGGGKLKGMTINVRHILVCFTHSYSWVYSILTSLSLFYLDYPLSLGGLVSDLAKA